MKKTISTLVAVLLTAVCLAQVPQKFNYQAIARASTGEFIKNQVVRIQFSVLDGGATGTEVYKEEHTVNTDANGLISAQVGGGTVQSGDFTKIDWSKGNMWLQTNLDAGSGFELLGAQELLSVPYAIHASVADSIVGGSANDVKINNLITRLDSLEKRIVAIEPPKIGDYKDGGIVVWIDSTGNHGLIVDLYSLGIAKWGCSNGSTYNGAVLQSGIGDGAQNTLKIINECTEVETAAALCINSKNAGFDDWFLPTESELQKCAFDENWSGHVSFINDAIVNQGGNSLAGPFWFSDSGRMTVRLSIYDTEGSNPNTQASVRAFRSF